MAAHLLYQDFLRFLDQLALSQRDPWELYQECYLRPHRAVLEAWWEQSIGLDREVWANRVRRVRPEDYVLLRELVSQADLTAAAAQAMSRCQALLHLSTEPEIYYLVGFFSPDAFAFQVAGEPAIGIGLERLPNLRLLPLLLAHEYGHCYRRPRGARRRPTSLGEHMVEEGFAVEVSCRAFPERPAHEHLLMTPGQVTSLAEYEGPLWEAVEPFLGSQDEAVIARLLYGRGERGEWPSRAGMYLGWRLVNDFLRRGTGGFDAPAHRVLQARAAAAVPR